MDTAVVSFEGLLKPSFLITCPPISSRPASQQSGLRVIQKVDIAIISPAKRDGSVMDPIDTCRKPHRLSWT
jgi:hypothetical protein